MKTIKLKWTNGGGQSTDNQWDYRFWLDMGKSEKGSEIIVPIRSTPALDYIKKMTVNSFKGEQGLQHLEKLIKIEFGGESDE